MNGWSNYNLEHKGVRCVGVKWDSNPTPIFNFQYNNKVYEYRQTLTDISFHADTDHIKYIIEYDFLHYIRKREPIPKNIVKSTVDFLSKLLEIDKNHSILNLNEQRDLDSLLDWFEKRL